MWFESSFQFSEIFENIKLCVFVRGQMPRKREHDPGLVSVEFNFDFQLQYEKHKNIMWIVSKNIFTLCWFIEHRKYICYKLVAHSSTNK